MWGISLIKRLREERHRVHALADHLRPQPAIPQISANFFHLPGIVFHHQHRLARKKFLVFMYVLNLEGNGHREAGTFPQAAFHPDFPAHLHHQAMADGQAKPRSLDFTLGRVARPLERQKHAGEELLAHAHPVILADELKDGSLLLPAQNLPQHDTDTAALLRIFHGVPDDVDQYLANAERVADELFLADVLDFELQRLLFLLCLRPHDDHHVVEHVRQGERLLMNCHFSALDVGHVQHVVNQAHQVGRRRLDLAQAIKHTVFLVNM